MISTSDGTTWTTQTAPSTVTNVDGVSCPSVTDCFAVGTASGAGAILSTTDGTTWATEVVPTGVTSLTGVACASATQCLAVGSASGTGVILSTTDGSTWTSSPLPTTDVSLAGVTCPTTADCFAVGMDFPTLTGVVLATTDGGTTWTTQTIPSVAQGLSGIDCPSSSECYAVGSNYTSHAGVVVVTTDGGETWTSQVVPSDVQSLSGVSCPSNDNCYASGIGTGQEGALVLELPALSVTPGSLPDATVGHGYSATFAATGGAAPYTWSLASGALPPGLVLDPSTGAVTGTPTAVGSYPFTVSVGDSSSPVLRGTSDLTITVVPSALVITTTALPGGKVGQPYSTVLAAAGGRAPYAWSVTTGALPSGLGLDAATGAITGTPGTSGTSPFTVTATDADSTSTTAALSIVVSGGGPPPAGGLRGYTLSAADGGTFAFGGAGFFGSMGGPT